MTDKTLNIGQDYEKQYGFHDKEEYVFKSKRGLTREIVEEISWMKNEPNWMRQYRLRALDAFNRKPLPAWADLSLLSQIRFDNIYYYLRPTEKQGKTWEEVPAEIKNTFDKLGIPEAERKFLAGVTAQYESEVVYHSLHEDLKKQGVIFLGMDDGLKQYPELVQKYFGTLIPAADNKFSALNSAVWSGGSFIYVPKGVQVAIPLQAYFRINAENMGQFERTLIIADEGSSVHYIEGCVMAGTPIATNPGYKPVEAIEPGERVLTHKGQYKRVLHTQVRPYSGRLFSIRMWGDAVAPLQITEEHPMLFVKRNGKNKPTDWKLQWGKPTDLHKGDYLVLPRRKETRPRQHGEFLIRLSVNDKKAIYQETVQRVPSTPEFFRLAGYFLAEGSILNNFYLSFAFEEHERTYIEDVKSLLRAVFGVTKIHELHHKKNHGVSLTVSSARLTRIFAHFGTSSSTKRIPDWMLFEEPRKQAELVLGFFRGDGNYIKTRYPSGPLYEKFRLSTTSRVLAYQLRDVLLRLGIVATVNGQDRRRENRQTMYTVIVGGAFLKPFGNLVGIPIEETINAHKRATLFHLDENYAYLPIRKSDVRTVHKVPVYNFSVEEDETYVAGGAAVHNCTAPVYSSDSLHSAVVELVALPHSHIRYTTIQNWSKNVYNLVTKRAIAHENATVEWLDGNLGCVRAGELVYTENGPKPIEEIGSGTRVWSFDEPNQKWVLRPVVARKDSGLQKVYEVRFSNGRIVHLTDNHPLLAVHHDPSRPSKLGRYSLRWTPLKQLSQGDFVVFPTRLNAESMGHRFDQPELRTSFMGRNQYGARYKVASHARLQTYLPDQSNEDICWILGLWIADGDYTVENGVNGGPRYGRVGWSVPREDRARKRLVELLEQYLGYTAIEERRDGHYFRTNSLEFALWLQSNGLSSGSKEKRVPHWVFALPTSMQQSFLAGYLDGDGCAMGTTLTAKSANRKLLSDIQMIATLCGLHSGAVHTEETTLDINGTGKQKTYTTHRLDLTRVRALRPFLSPGLRSRLTEAKLNHRAQSPMGMRAKKLLREDVGVARIVSIRPSVIAPTYDLEVDGTCSFVVNGILVHNSKLTMKYPAVYLVGRKARGEVVSVAFSGKDQHQDAGAKMVHAAPETSSTILSKSISKDGGQTSYRGLVKVYPDAENVKSSVRCDALLMDELSRSDTYPTMEIDAKKVRIEHEATVSKVGEEEIFYLMSRGLKEQEATTMIVNGFFEAFVKELPLEYAVELNRLVQLEMEGSIG